MLNMRLITTRPNTTEVIIVLLMQYDIISALEAIKQRINGTYVETLRSDLNSSRGLITYCRLFSHAGYALCGISCFSVELN